MSVPVFRVEKVLEQTYDKMEWCPTEGGERRAMTLTTETGIPETGEHITERLAGVRAELARIAQAPFTQLGHEEACQVASGIEQLTRGVEGLHTAAVGGLAAGTGWAASGYQSFPAFWSAHTHRRKSTSHAAWHQAREMADHLPLTRRAVQAGQIGGEHVKVLTRFATKTPALRDQLADAEMGEGFLLAQAARMPVELYSRLVKEWAIQADPESADRGWREEGARAEVFLSQVMDVADLRGWLGTEDALVFEEALRAMIGTPAADDQRTMPQRRADALVQLCRSYLDSGQGQPGARIRPHIALTVDYATLAAVLAAIGVSAGAPGTGRDAFGLPVPLGNDAARLCRRSGQRHSHCETGDAGDDPGCGRVVISAGLDYELLRGVAPATFADGTPIPHGQLAKLLCDGEFHRVIFGPEGEILDSGRTQRLFTPAQTRAVLARDRHCQYPGCSAPPWLGEIHHSIWWYHQGATRTDNAILLCWYHHTYVHQHHLTITQHVSGPDKQCEWIFTDSDGRRLRATPPPGQTEVPGGAGLPGQNGLPGGARPPGENGLPGGARPPGQPPPVPPRRE